MITQGEGERAGEQESRQGAEQRRSHTGSGGDAEALHAQRRSNSSNRYNLI
jgi:hypothetical protein